MSEIITLGTNRTKDHIFSSAGWFFRHSRRMSSEFSGPTSVEPCQKASLKRREGLEARLRRNRQRYYLQQLSDIIGAFGFTLIVILAAGAPVFITLLSSPDYMQFCDDSRCPKFSRCIQPPGGAKHCLCIGNRTMINGTCDSGHKPVPLQQNSVCPPGTICERNNDGVKQCFGLKELLEELDSKDLSCEPSKLLGNRTATNSLVTRVCNSAFLRDPHFLKAPLQFCGENVLLSKHKLHANCAPKTCEEMYADWTIARCFCGQFSLNGIDCRGVLELQQIVKPLPSVRCAKSTPITATTEVA